MANRRTAVEEAECAGFAGMLHGSSLVTRDLDACAVLSADNVRKLREISQDLHPVHRLTPQ
jgi:hypothetical protein